MDEFAQSRGEDDLFSDDFEPASAPTLIEEPSYSPVSRDVRNETPEQQNQYRGQGQDRRQGGPRNRGNGRNHNAQSSGNRMGTGGVGGGLSTSRWATQDGHAATNAELRQQAALSTSAPVASVGDSAATKAAPESIASEAAAAERQATPPQLEATAPPVQPVQPVQSSNSLPQPTRAVRGDRSATGGPAHKKLTEEELSEKMAKMAIINAQKAERFRLSEADSAAFQLKEAELRRKRVEEQKNARAMDMERAKNRERKLQAQGGREWDSEKLESDIVDRTKGRSCEYVRGGHGGVMRGDFAGRGFASVDDDVGGGGDSGYYRGGRGGFEIRGRGGRGGGREGAARGGKVAPPVLKSAEEFPSLLGASTKKAGGLGDSKWADTPDKSVEATAAAASTNVETAKPVVGTAADWADEVADPVDW